MSPRCDVTALFSGSNLVSCNLPSNRRLVIWLAAVAVKKAGVNGGSWSSVAPPTGSSNNSIHSNPRGPWACSEQVSVFLKIFAKSWISQRPGSFCFCPSCGWAWAWLEAVSGRHWSHACLLVSCLQFRWQAGINQLLDSHHLHALCIF